MMTVKMRVLATLSLCSWIFFSFPGLSEAANVTFEAEGQVLVCYDGREFDGESVVVTEVKGRYNTAIYNIIYNIYGGGGWPRQPAVGPWLGRPHQLLLLHGLLDPLRRGEVE